MIARTLKSKNAWIGIAREQVKAGSLGNKLGTGKDKISARKEIQISTARTLNPVRTAGRLTNLSASGIWENDNNFFSRIVIYTI